MSWFTVKQGRLVYRGRLTRDSYGEWLKTPEGAGRLDSIARSFRLRAFGRTRAGNRLWRPLERAARGAPLRHGIQGETAQFCAAMSQVSYAPGLPRAHVALHRLVLVPRSLVAARARTAARLRLWNLPALADVDEAVRAFFCEQLLIEIDRAFEAWRPTATRAIPAAEGWACVGMDRGYVWVDPLWSGAHWSGHYFMYEYPRAPLSGAQRKELEHAVVALQHGIGVFSRLQREALIRTAADGLAPAPAR